MKLITSALASLLMLSMMAAAHPDYAASSSERRVARSHVMLFQHLVARASSNGATCKEDTDCNSGNCKASTTFIIGNFRSARCTAKVGNGSSCDVDKDCNSGYCTSTGFFSGKKCAANPVAAGSVATGGKCNRSADCASQICDLNKCRVKETGESCTVDANCPSGNVCIGASENRLRCYATNLANGAYCLQDKQCKSGYCNNQCTTRAVAVGTTVPGSVAASATGTSVAASATGTSVAASATGTDVPVATGTDTEGSGASQTSSSSSSSSTSSSAAATGTSTSGSGSNKGHGHQHQQQSQPKTTKAADQPKQAAAVTSSSSSSSAAQSASTTSSSTTSDDDDSIWHNTNLPGHGQEVFKCVRVW